MLDKLGVNKQVSARMDMSSARLMLRVFRRVIRVAV